MPTKTRVRKKKTDNPTTGEKVRVKVEFTREELLDRTTKLTQLLQQVEVEEGNIKASAATARARLKDMQAQVKDMANQVRNGYEEREIDALVEFDRKKGIKHYTFHCPGQTNHGKHIKTVNMTEEDYALLPLAPREPEPQPEPPKAPEAPAPAEGENSGE